MDAIQKELEKLHKRLPALVEPKGYNAEVSSAASISRAKDTSSNVFYALDQLIHTFEEAQQRLVRQESSVDPSILLSELRASVGQAQRGVNERQKEYYSALSKLGKALEKKFPTSTASLTDSRIFTSVQAQHSLESVVLEHFLRNGDWDLAEELAMVRPLSLCNSLCLYLTVSWYQTGSTLDSAIANRSQLRGITFGSSSNRGW
jgi:hypothetical protein